jgi:predicted phosphoribosyltransferase
MPTDLYRHRRHAGQVLARSLTGYARRGDVTVLALPRGGVPVAFEVARALELPMDLFLVRKLGVPGNEELAMGAVASGGVRVLNSNVINVLCIDEATIEAETRAEQAELARREALYRGARPPPGLKGRSVILVDDGLATGATMLAALKALKAQEPARVVVAVPAAPRELCEQLRHEADEVVCARTPEPLQSVGQCYEDFSETSDDEVRALVAEAAGWFHGALPTQEPGGEERRAGRTR